MTLEISTIKNEVLRKTAEKADSNGPESYNGKLDKSEIIDFASNAQKEGFAMEDVLEIAKTVTGEDSPEVQQIKAVYEEKLKAEKQKQTEEQYISELEKRIVDIDKEIKTRQKKKEDIFSSKKLSWTGNAASFFGALLGAMGGGLVGAMAGALIPKRKNGVVSILGAIGGALLGGYALSKGFVALDKAFDYDENLYGDANPDWPGVLKNDNDPSLYKYNYLFKEVNNYPISYEDKVNANRANTFEADSIQPLKDEKARLEKELEAKKQEQQK